MVRSPSFSIPKHALKEANEKLSKHLDLLSSIQEHKLPFEIDKSRLFVVSESGELLHYSIELVKPDISHYSYLNSLDFTFKRQYILDSLKDKQIDQFNNIDSFIDDRLQNALHWQRKAYESTSDSDKLLFYWIAIENLFYTTSNMSKDLLDKDSSHKIVIIREVLSACLLLSELHSRAWNIYNHYRDRHFLSSQSIFPKELLISSQIYPQGSYINLPSFVKELKNILLYEKNIKMIIRIENVIRLFENTDYQFKESTAILNNFSDDVLMIYRYRNLIVHNAQYNSFILPSYTSKVRIFCHVLINSILHSVSSKKSLNQILIGFKQHKDWYLEELKSGNNHII